MPRMMSRMASSLIVVVVAKRMIFSHPQWINTLSFFSWRGELDRLGLGRGELDRLGLNRGELDRLGLNRGEVGAR